MGNRRGRGGRRKRGNLAGAGSRLRAGMTREDYFRSAPVALLDGNIPVRSVNVEIGFSGADFPDQVRRLSLRSQYRQVGGNLAMAGGCIEIDAGRSL